MQSSEYISIWGTDSVSSDWMTNTRAWFSLLSWNGGFSQSLKLNCCRWKFWPNLQIAKHEESAIARIHFWTALCLVNRDKLQLLQSRGVKLCVFGQRIWKTSWASLRINLNKRRLFAFLCTNAQENLWLLWYFKCFENMWGKNKNKDPAEFHRCSCSCDPLGNSPAIAVLQFEVTWVKTTWSVWQLERDFRPEYNQ